MCHRVPFASMEPMNREGPRRRWPWVVAGVVVLLLVLSIDLVWAGSRAVSASRRTRDALKAGGQLLMHGDLPESRASFDDAVAAAKDAQAALDHPGVTVAGWVPGLARNVDAARRAADAAEFAGEGGQLYVSAAETAGWDASSLPGISPGGHLDTTGIVAATPDIEAAADRLRQANDELAGVDPSGLLPPLDRLIGDAKTEIASRAQQAATA